MSSPVRPADEISRLARALQDERFVRGLGIGALIGAAIAGSTLWNRRREARAANEPAGGDTHAAPGSHEAPDIAR